MIAVCTTLEIFLHFIFSFWLQLFMWYKTWYPNSPQILYNCQTNYIFYYSSLESYLLAKTVSKIKKISQICYLFWEITRWELSCKHERENQFPFSVAGRKWWQATYHLKKKFPEWKENFYGSPFLSWFPTIITSTQSHQEKRKVHDKRHSLRLAGNTMALHIKFMLKQQANDYHGYIMQMQPGSSCLLVGTEK